MILQGLFSIYMIYVFKNIRFLWKQKKKLKKKEEINRLKRK